ncbi:MAG: hypothetical protein CR997_00870 [Acidobacteria bacterium]|nr:MAG: hypothetical protein CR997_00870 [Acidobacteriota bacterium]
MNHIQNLKCTTNDFVGGFLFKNLCLSVFICGSFFLTTDGHRWTLMFFNQMNLWHPNRGFFINEWRSEPQMLYQPFCEWLPI